MIQTQIIKNKRTEGKIKKDYGIPEYFKYFKENNESIKISNKTYNNVISMFNKELINIIIEDNFTYVLPHMGSSISIKKRKCVPRIVDGKLINPSPVDWVATNKLWFEDDESKEKKLLVRYANQNTSKHVFLVSFKKYIYPFFNKRFYNFKTCRSFQRLLSARIKDEDKPKYDTFLLY